MSLIKRLKVATKSFLNPSLIEPKIITENIEKVIEKPIIQIKEKEPNLVFDNRLLANKNVLITGAGQNMGRSIAIEMAKQGANIYFTNIDNLLVEKLARELNTYTVKSKGFAADITNQKDTENILSYLANEQICIDILVNHIGIQFNKFGIDKIEIEDWQKIFNTNIFTPILLTKKISQIMIDNQIQGSIIFTTSVHQSIVFREMAYSASKAALKMIIKEFAVDLAPHHIRVNGIAPGVVDTDENGRLRYFKHNLLGQSSIDPVYIGRGVVYLASDYFSRFTTGITLNIDAGLPLYSYRLEQNFL